MEALSAVLEALKWFADQKERNDGAKKETAALMDQVLRMGPVLNPLISAKGLDRARLVLDNLGACLGQARHIYYTYRGGWSIKKCWVTPGQILEKTRRTQTQISQAFQELTLALNIANHVKEEETTPITPFEESKRTWEIAFSDLTIDLSRTGMPREVLGKGAFGIVALATLKGDQVAVKMALPNMLVGATQNTDVVSAYQKEICLMCRLEHPNIVSCYGMITHDDDGELLMWCVMEKLDVDLFKAVTTGQLQMGKDNAPLFVSLLGSFVSALAYLHSPLDKKPIVHRDLKPENIMLDKNNILKIVDFGLAKETVLGVGSTMNVKGTKQWMAPEQITSGGCSTMSDMYAAGLIAIFMWNGQSPSAGPVPCTQSIGCSSDPRAARALELMRLCLNKEAQYRPRAASIHREIASFCAPAPSPSASPAVPPLARNKSSITHDLCHFLQDLDIDDPNDLEKLEKLGIKKTADLLTLDLDDFEEDLKSLLTLPAKKKLKAFVRLSEEEKRDKISALSNSAGASSSTASAASTHPSTSSNFH